MAGRRITNHTEAAKAKREHMRRLRESRRLTPPPFDPRPLAQALANWNRT
jgi:hypothetical protein